jgi:hypothetical protein
VTLQAAVAAAERSTSILPAQSQRLLFPQEAAMEEINAWFPISPLAQPLWLMVLVAAAAADTLVPRQL